MEIRTEDYSEVPLGLGLELVDGRGFLSARNERVGPLDVKLLELEIPQLEFPFDTSGGPGAFKSRRCTLRQLALGLSSERVVELLSSARLRTKGFSNIRVGFKEGTMELGGTFSQGEQEVDFTTRASLVPGDGLLLNVIFFDLRVYGALSVPAPLIPVYLCEALELPYITASRCAAWELQPAGEFLRSVLPRMGWKIPDYRDASIVNVGVNRDQIVLVCGDAEAEGEMGEGPEFPRPGLEAIYAAEAMVLFRNAEKALAAGEIGAAYDGYKGAAGGEQLGAWAVARLLQIGVCEPRFHAETRELARAYSEENPGDVQGDLALAAIALAENRPEEAAELYVKIAGDSALDNNRFDTNAAELAAARAFELRDIDRAISHYEKAASRDRTSVPAYAGIFRLRCAREDWEGAKPAGERLVRLDLPDELKAHYWCELGDIYLSRLESVKMARRSFEQALRGVDDCEAALEGLAQTYITQGEPARAVGYLTRLFEKVRLDRRVDRMGELGLQLGGLWENELGDLKAAIEHYQFVIGLSRRERTARMRLARLYVGQERWDQARLLYDDLIAIMQEDDRPECLADFVEANLGLAHLLRTTGAQGWEVLECLERVLERSPDHREALESAAPLLRAEAKWQQLVVRLRALSALSPEAELRVGFLSECAEVYADKLCAMDLSRACLEEILDIQPDNEVALKGLREAVESGEELPRFGLRLEKAAVEVADLEEKGDLWLELARHRARQEAPVYETLEAYGKALEYNPYRVDGARELVALVAPLDSPEGHAEALLLLANATTDSLERAGALLERSRILWRTLKSTDTVKESLREVLQTTPDCLEAGLLLAELLEETGCASESITALGRCLEHLQAQDPACVQIYEHLARLTRKIEDPAAEVSHLETLVEMRGREELTCRRLVDLLNQLDRTQDAAEHLEAWARAGDVEDPAALTLEAIGYWDSLGQSARVIDLCDGLIQERFARGVVEQASSTPSPAQQAALWLEKTYREKGATESVVQAIQYQLLLGPEDYSGTLRSLTLAQIAMEDFLSAETTCRTLLEHAPGSRLAHGFLASRHDARESYLVALIHWMSYLNSDDNDDVLDMSALNPRERAISLAQEVAPGSLSMITLLESVGGAVQEGGLSRSAVAPLGDELAEAERWDAFLRLREWQFEQKIPGDWITWKWEVATVLHRKLSRYDDGIAVYREICGLTTPGNNHSSTAQQCIIEIYEHGERWEELSRFLMELSEVETCQEEALRLGLDAADVLMRQGGDLDVARSLYRGINLRFGCGDCITPLLSALREHGLHEDIAQLLELNLEYSWVTDDGRFLELVELLAGRLGRPEQAVHLAEKATRYMPQVDLGWRTLVELLEEHEGMGCPDGVLYRWGELSEPAKREAVYEELYQRLIQAGGESSHFAVHVLLKRIAIAEDPVPLMGALIQHYLDDHSYERALEWLECLLDKTSDSTERDILLRRAFKINHEQLQDSARSIAQLTRLQSLSPDEALTLGELLVECGDWAGIERRQGDWDLFSSETHRSAGEHWLERGELDKARGYFERYLETGGDDEVIWGRVERPFRKAGRLEELGWWRIAWANAFSPDEPHFIRLIGAAEVIEASDSTSAAWLVLREKFSKDFDLSLDFDAVNLGSEREAWKAYTCARVCEFAEWLERSAKALERLLRAEDPRLPEIITVRYRQEMGQEHFETASGLARRLIQLKVPGAHGCLDAALVAGGLEEELLEFLEAQVALREQDAPRLLARVVQICQASGDWSGAVRALGRVEESLRDEAWGKSACEVGEACGDDALRVSGMSVRAQCAMTQEHRAEWDRCRARVLWWDMDDPEGAHALLRSAQGVCARPPEYFLEQTELCTARGELLEARRWLHEGLLFHEGAASVPLRFALADLFIEEGQGAEAHQELIRVTYHLGNDGGAWMRVGERATRIEERALEAMAWERAYQADRTCFEPLRVFLEQNADWKQLTTLLLERGAELSGANEAAAAAECWDEAGRIVSEHLDDSTKGLQHWMEACRLKSSQGRLWRTLELSVELEEFASAVSVGEMLLSSLKEDDERREEVLRALLVARDALGQEAGALELLRVLVELKAASSEETLRFARTQDESAPELAAALYERTALGLKDAALKAEYLYRAAVCRERVGQREEASSSLSLALASGLDEPAAYVMALGLWEGSEREKAIEGVLAHQEDVLWSRAKRASLRRELAEFALKRRAFEEGLGHVVAAAAFEESVVLVALKEAALKGKEDFEALARIWIDEGLSPLSPWSGAALYERLGKAADYYRRHGQDENEFIALGALCPAMEDSDERLERVVELACTRNKREVFDDVVARRLRCAEEGVLEAEMIRYGNLCCDYFGAVKQVIGMLESRFRTHPSQRMAEELEQYYSIDERESDSYRAYMRLLVEDKSNKKARTFCINYTADYELWDEWLDLAEYEASCAGTEHERYEWLSQMAQCQLNKFEDHSAVIDLLYKMMEWDNYPRKVAQQLYGLLLDNGRYHEGLEVLSARVFPEAEEEAIANDLMQKLDVDASFFERERVRDWLIEAHPDCETALGCRVEQARAAKDAPALLRAVTELLEVFAPESPQELRQLSEEAGHAGLEAGERGAALNHFMKALSLGQRSPDTLFTTYRLAVKLEALEARNILLDICGEEQDPLKSWAVGAWQGKRLNVHHFIADVYAHTHQIEASIEERLKCLCDLRLEAQRELLKESLKKAQSSEVSERLIDRLYDELIRVSRELEDTGGLLEHRLAQVLEASGGLDELYEVYALSCSQGNAEARDLMVTRACALTLRLPQWLDERDEGEGGETLRFGMDVYSAAGKLESAVRVRQRLWEEQPPACMETALVEAINELEEAGLSLETALGAELHQRLLALDEANPSAREFCLRLFEQEGTWSEWLRLAKWEFENADDVGEKRSWLFRMVECQRKNLNDDDAAIGVLYRYLDWEECREETGQQLYGMLVEKARFLEAWGVLTERVFPLELERNVAQDLLRRLDETASFHDCERARGWFVANHPKSEIAINRRLEKARSGEDRRELVDALAAKLECHVPRGSDEFRELSMEAAQGAIDSEDDERSLKHTMVAIEHGERAPHVLFSAFEVASRLEDVGAVNRVLDISRQHVGVLKLWASNVMEEERLGVHSFIAEIYLDSGKITAAVEERLKTLVYLRPGEQRQVLCGCRDALKETTIPHNAPVYREIYIELVRVARELGDAKEVLQYRLVLALAGGGDFSDLYDIYTLCLDMDDPQARKLIVDRAGRRSSELPGFVEIFSEGERTGALRFAAEVYATIGNVEDSVSARLQLWEAEPPPSWTQALERCLQELRDANVSTRSSLYFDLYRRLLDIDAAHGGARSFYLEHFETQGLWEQWLGMAETEVQLAGNSQERYGWLIRMAQCQLDRRGDTDAGRELLRQIVEWEDCPQPLAQRLHGLLLEEGRYRETWSVFVRRIFPETQELALAEAFMEEVSGQGLSEESAVAQRWILDVYPSSQKAVEHRLEQARSRENPRALLEELTTLLELYPPVEFERQQELVLESAWAAMEIRNYPAALNHFRAVLKQGERAPDLLFSAYGVARDLEAEEDCEWMMKLCGEEVEELKEWACARAEELRAQGHHFVAEVCFHGGDIIAGVRERIKALPWQRLIEQKKQLNDCLKLLVEEDSSPGRALKNKIYDELVRISGALGDSNEQLQYRLTRVFEREASLAELHDVYRLCVELEDPKARAAVVERAVPKLSEVLGFVAEMESSDAGSVLRFASELYDAVEDRESSVHMRLKLWDVEPPSSLQAKLGLCLEELKKAKLPATTPVVLEIHERLLGLASEAQDEHVRLTHALSLMEGGLRECSFVCEYYELAVRLKESEAQRRLIDWSAPMVDEVADWVKATGDQAQRMRGLEFVYELYRRAEAPGDAARIRLMQVEKLPASQARTALAECLKDLKRDGVTGLAGVRAQLLHREGLLAYEAGDLQAASDAWWAARALTHDDAEIREALRRCMEDLEDWEKVEMLRLEELADQSDPQVRHGQLMVLAGLYQGVLNAPERRMEMLTEAVEINAEDVESLQALVDFYQETEDWEKFSGCVEKLLTLVDEAELKPDFLSRVAWAYDTIAEDWEKAIYYYRLVALERPHDLKLREILRRLSVELKDYETFASVEIKMLGDVEDKEEKIKRTFELMGILRDQLEDREGADLLRSRAVELVASNRVLIRTLADEYSAVPATYRLARDMYSVLLCDAPLEKNILRILARLCGQLGDVERAYGYYSTLLAVIPGDDEARRYVEACREVRVELPRRSMTDDERQRLRHAGLEGRVDEFYSPLARHVEAAERGSLARRGVKEGDLLPPTHQQHGEFAQLLEILDVQQASLYRWRGGGFECDVELMDEPTLLVGSSVFTAPSRREAMFLVARTGELYRAGHTLCERMNASALNSLLSALALAVDSELVSGAVDDKARRAARGFAEALSESVKSSSRNEARYFVEQSGQAEVKRWRSGAQATACRTALLLTCDVSEATEALLRLHDRETDTYRGRVEAMGALPELMDLVQFAASEEYFELRESLGLSISNS